MLYKDIQSWWAKMRGKPDPNAKISFIHQDRLEKGDEFWALRNINLEIEEGEIVGIIGRNGAGKSTLLKILSQITAPTEGKIHVNGRMASLLEVGTGFHPELTGRENVYLNGAILGMSRREVSKKFDEIVDFSEVENFIDTPVKRYSSGMYVRLAFSVAAHLEPEILIVDEVLAVGDLQFQKKCLGKMQDVNSNGRTVLFVSHNMTTINSLCGKCALISNGCVDDFGFVDSITKKYFNSLNDEANSLVDYGDNGPGDDYAKLCSIRLINPKNEVINFVRIDERFGIEILLKVFKENSKITPNFHFFKDNQCIFISAANNFPITNTGMHRAVVWIPPNLLNDGLYFVNVAASTMSPVKVHFRSRNKFCFNVIEDIHAPSRGGYANSIPGMVRPCLEWDVQKL
ncbi:MAG: ABC transporter ATP-binding protein [Verrucomicrobia bacterium]|nr:ABC transporter ATP-binding protein [Verrucomicrobiota bacterium]